MLENTREDREKEIEARKEQNRKYHNLEMF